MQDELQKTLDFAIAKEEQAEAFYREWAEKAQLPAVTSLFTELASVERAHAEKLRNATASSWVAGPDAPQDLKLSDLLVEIEASPAMSLQEAMIIAMKREEAAVELYERLATLGGDAQPLFRALADEERGHKHRLETEYDDVILTEN
jgi:rubrerythrin